MGDSADPAPTQTPPPSATPANPLRRLYRWILSWANHPWGTAVLALLSFLDSFIFPIPPLFLQIALSLERPKRSLWYASVNTVASVLGAIAGYWIGYTLWSSVGVKIVGEFPEAYKNILVNNQFFITLLYSFVPLPFKVITLGSGFLHLNIATLLIASTLGRSSRFFLLGVICFIYGNRAREFIERHFNRACFIGAVALAALAVAGKLIHKSLTGS